MSENIISAFEQLLDSRLGKVHNDYLDIQGACFILGVSKSTVYKLNHRKAVPYFKPEGAKKCYYLKKDLVNYMTKNRFKSQQEIDEEVKRFLSKKEGGNHD